MTYEGFRQFADSWGLVYMVAVFVAVIIFVLRPGARSSARDAADIPFKDDR
jgi:cytochrome c oxidase cbb3-type subunit 4